MVKVTKEKEENRQAFLSIEMEPAEVEESLEESYHRLVKRANIPGFRKGKAPRAILERYLGKESLFEDTLRYLLPEAYQKAISEQKIEAIAQPQIEVVQNEPLIFKATVPLTPTVKLGDYHQVKLTPEPVTVTEENINAVIEQLRHQHATWEPVDRPVVYNDMVVLSIESSIEGKPFVNQKDAQYQVLPDSPFPMTGFAAQLVGMKRDEEKEFKLSFPADYPRSEMAGKEASFKVKIAEIKQERLPELNDQFAQQVDPECKTADTLRQKVSEQLRNRAEEKARRDFEEKMVGEVTKLAEVAFPPVLVEMEIDHLLDHQTRQLQQGGVNIDEYLKSIKKTPEQLREELHPQASNRLTRSLVLDKVAEEEKIEVSDAEVETEIENVVTTAASRKDEIRKSLSTDNARNSIKHALLIQKTLKRLAEIAQEPKQNQVIEKEGKGD